MEVGEAGVADIQKGSLELPSPADDDTTMLMDEHIGSEPASIHASMYKGMPYRALSSSGTHCVDAVTMLAFPASRLTFALDVSCGRVIFTGIELKTALPVDAEATMLNSGKCAGTVPKTVRLVMLPSPPTTPELVEDPPERKYGRALPLASDAQRWSWPQLLLRDTVKVVLTYGQARMSVCWVVTFNSTLGTSETSVDFDRNVSSPSCATPTTSKADVPGGIVPTIASTPLP